MKTESITESSNESVYKLIFYINNNFDRGANEKYNTQKF